MANPSLTPLQFLQRYQNLKVNYFPPDGGPHQRFTGIRLKKYYINSSRKVDIKELEARIAANEEDGLTKEEKDQNKRFRQKIAHKRQSNQMQKLVSKLKSGRSRDTRFTLQEVRYGKGLPEDYELFLGLAAAAGMCDVGKGGPTRRSIQRFLDDSMMGIDCSGYVSAYFAARGDIAESTREHKTREGAAEWGDRKGNKKITRISDIRMGDCLVRVNRKGKLVRSPGHIMLAAGRGRADSETSMEFKPLNLRKGHRKFGKGGEYMGESRGALYICESRGGGLKHGPARFKDGYPNKRNPYFIIRRHGMSDWLPCIVVRPHFAKSA